MILRGARIALDARRAVHADAVIEDGRIFLRSGVRAHSSLDLSGYLLLPGLINAHDHLEFNLFPRLGAGPYANAKVWAEDAYQPGQDPVKQHKSVDKRARLLWGGLKNLLAGVTTVAHHNPYEAVFDDDFPVRVVRSFGWAHSLDFSPDIAGRFQATPLDWPFIVHAAEGVDEKARAEIRRLDELGVLTDRTVLVHAIGAGPAGYRLLASRGTSVVWCPTSNLSLFGETLSAEAREVGIDIALGTDSAITAQTNLAEEVAFAHRISSAPLENLYAMVTTNPARMLRLRQGEGTLRDGGAADFIAVRDRGQTPAEALLDLHPELVVVGGQIRLMSDQFHTRTSELGGFHRIEVSGHGVRFTDVDLPWLHRETVKVLGPDYRLAGRQVSA